MAKAIYTMVLLVGGFSCSANLSRLTGVVVPKLFSGSVSGKFIGRVVVLVGVTIFISFQALNGRFAVVGCLVRHCPPWVFIIVSVVEAVAIAIGNATAIAV